jgi:hypothetical protein
VQDRLFITRGRCPGLVCFGPFGPSAVCGSRFRRMNKKNVTAPKKS